MVDRRLDQSNNIPFINKLFEATRIEIIDIEIWYFTIQ